MKNLRWILIGSLSAMVSVGAVGCGDDGGSTTTGDTTDEKDSGSDTSSDTKSTSTKSDAGTTDETSSAAETSAGDTDAGATGDTAATSADAGANTGSDEDAAVETTATDDAGEVTTTSEDAGTDASTPAVGLCDQDVADYLAELGDHPNVDCDGDGKCEISGEVLEDLTLCDYGSDVSYVLAANGYTFVGNDEDETVFTIEAGVTLKGAAKSALVFRRGSKIMAEGTAEKPIVLTTTQEAGSREPGQWGGLVLNGRAPSNKGANVDGEAGSGVYGGDQPDDSSGVLKYVSVQFAGDKVDAENELNGIAFQGVGSGTEVDYVQVHFNSDDGVEFFGGTVNVKHLVLTGNTDDSFDWTDGWSGTAQFVVAAQGLAEVDNGIEGDNQKDDNNATPRSNPTLANFTLLGAPVSGEGIQLRAGTNATIYNTAVVGFGASAPCLTIETDPSLADVTIKNTTLYCSADQAFFDSASQDVFETDGWNNSLVEDMDAIGLADWTGVESADWQPMSDSPLLGVDELDVSGLDKVDYIGAFGEDDNWAEGWIITDVD